MESARVQEDGAEGGGRERWSCWERQRNEGSRKKKLLTNMSTQSLGSAGERGHGQCKDGGGEGEDGRGSERRSVSRQKKISKILKETE